LTANVHSSHDLNRPEAKRFRVTLTNLNVPKIDLVEVFIDLLEAENLKSKNFADEYPAFMPANVAAVVHVSLEIPSRCVLAILIGEATEGSFIRWGHAVNGH
jgi:hypothetical protein